MVWTYMLKVKAMVVRSSSVCVCQWRWRELNGWDTKEKPDGIVPRRVCRVSACSVKVIRKKCENQGDS